MIQHLTITQTTGKCKKYAIKPRRKQPITQSLYTNITTPVASSQKNISPTHTQYWNATLQTTVHCNQCL